MAPPQVWVRGALRGEAATVEIVEGHAVLRVALDAGTARVPFHGGAALKLAEQLLAAGRYVLIPPRDAEAAPAGRADAVVEVRA